ncbi:MAG: hypothetical protein HY242_09040 [Afipia sp.]|nr:hypothetical protein [Afipia sp.]
MLDNKAKLALFASGSLGLGGVILMALGAYFAFLRPALLPEDLKFMSSSVAQIQSALPGLQAWLTRVFGVLGGFMFAAGLLTGYIAATSRSAGTIRLTMIIAVAGLTSIGWMAITNFLIDSDFKWLLLTFTFPWLFAVALYSISNR